jgi:tRNA pseudouridine32 synthase/23S rRNA pseudouridine746 synthase
MAEVSELNTYIHLFDNPEDLVYNSLELNNPFDINPPEIAVKAASKLKKYLNEQNEWEHSFGLNSPQDLQATGKMFGVLVVQVNKGQIGYLQAFSGKVAGQVHLPGFVPPVFDMLKHDGFFRMGELELIKMTNEIEFMEMNPILLELQDASKKIRQQAEEAIKAARLRFSEAKELRAQKRSESEDVRIHRILGNESSNNQKEYKQIVGSWKSKILEIDTLLEKELMEINILKEKRRNKSASIQNKLFESYNFYNQFLDKHNLLDLFRNRTPPIPPAGAGDCAAPKLFQFAFEHNLKPLAIAEFWWGKSPVNEIRQHGAFYPACKGKCEPILSHMLNGISYPERKIFKSIGEEPLLEIVFEDASILVINKPSRLLSVPGKGKLESVYSILVKKYKAIEGPVIVHRLDMDTSGLMVIAKTLKAYHAIQEQFIQKTIKKRYVAILEGELNMKSGEINLPLRVDHYDRPRQLVCFERGKPSMTAWETVSVLNGRTRVNLFPHTGRTHQLRVHCAHEQGLGLSIVGDILYGKAAERLHLHAEEISFLSPENGMMMNFCAPAPF